MSTSSAQPLRIGTRHSPLARVQTEMVIAALAYAHPDLPAPDIAPIKTTGDRITDRPLADIGGKGLFAKEIDAALLAGDIDLAVHSLKDVETHLPDGIALAAVLPRGDPRDALIGAESIDALPQGARVGTSSVRRRAQLLARRPDLAIVPLRGNVNTRLQKIGAGEADATLLAMAGLDRLGLRLDKLGGGLLDPADMLPSAAQGIIVIACREADRGCVDLLSRIDDGETAIAAKAERALLAALDGSCRTPIGAYARVMGDRLHLRGLVASEDGTDVISTDRIGLTAEAEAMGRDAGDELRRRAPAHLFAV
jgi:hydroxymethylbilane synthase